MGAKGILASMKSGGTVFRHSEYICDVESPGPGSPFVAMAPFTINPGNLVTFPWGSNIANCFEEYRLRGCVFEFRTLCTENATGSNPSMGSVLMGTKYNALQSNFDSKMEMENYEYTTSCKPSQSMMHPINCKGITNKLFINNGAKQFSAEADRRLYDLANFTIATNGLQATAGESLGELWVHYEVVLYKPKLVTDNASLWDEWYEPSSAAQGDYNDYFGKGAASLVENSRATFNGSFGRTDVGTIPANAPKAWENWTSAGVNVAFDGTKDMLKNCYYMFPPNMTEGQFQVTIRWIGTAAAGTLEKPVIGTFGMRGATKAPKILVSPGQGIEDNQGAIVQFRTDKTGAVMSFVLDLNGPNQGFSLQPTAAAANWMSNTGFYLFINEIAGSWSETAKYFGGGGLP